MTGRKALDTWIYGNKKQLLYENLRRNEMKSERNISLDALRAFAIIGVITLHLVGGVDTLELTQGNRLIVNIFLAVTYCSVNLFGLLSGYLKIERPHHYDSLIRIILQTIYWCFLITIICAVFFKQRTLWELIGNAFPFINDRLWYISCYFFLFLCVPYLNLTAKRLSQKSYKLLLLSLTFLMSFIPTFCLRDFFHVVNMGYSAGWLIFMYLLGGYYKLYGFGKWLSRKKALALLLVSNCAIILSKYVLEIILQKMGLRLNAALLLFYYCSPLMLLNSICILYLFINKSWKENIIGKGITWLSGVSLGVYIIHAHPFCLDYILIGENLKWIVQDNPIFTFLICVMAILTVALLTGLAEQIRIIIFRVCSIDKMIKKLGSKVDRLMAIEEQNDFNKII